MSGTAAARPSRWGTLLSGAVANLESRLDTFFEEEGVNKDTKHQNNLPQPIARPTPTNTTNDSTTSQDPSLAKLELLSGNREVTALIPSSAHLTSQPFSEPHTHGLSTSESNALVWAIPDGAPPEAAPATFLPVRNIPTEADTRSGVKDEETSIADSAAEVAGAIARMGASSSSNSSERPSLDIHEASVTTKQLENDSLVHDLGEELSTEAYPSQSALSMQADHQNAEMQRQEEAHSYLERIDALQAKLQYLAKEAAESARRSAADNTGDLVQKRLAAKDEQIALLMEEGQKLSKSEVSQAGVARKLRVKIAEESRSLAETKRRLAASEKTSNERLDRVRKLEISQRDSSGKSYKISQLEKELQSVKASRDEQQSTVHHLRNLLDTEAKATKESEVKDLVTALDQQRLENKSLQEDLENEKIEQQLGEERLRAVLKDVTEELSREQESKKIADVQMRNEINVLESRLESMRIRTEEATSSTGTDSQTKLMRQVEVLQSQYAVASENWQTLESSLQARMATMEKERDDTGRAEADARRRARDSGTVSRRLQEQLEDMSRKCSKFEQEAHERQAHASRLTARATDLENRLREANSRFEQERQSWNATLTSRIEEERTKWRQETSALAAAEPSFAQLESPTASTRKAQGLDLSMLATRRGVGARHFSTELSIPTVNERLPGRRSSARPPRSSGFMSPSALESGRSTPVLNGGGPETPSIHTMDHDDMFDDDSSPHRTVNDMISVSTAGAGPSVQVVERMSAAVRRLESEKAATKDELARLVRQRDEGRSEVVSMMNELEDKRLLDAKVLRLEQDMAKAEHRHQTTLEMLGEKSERVEELEADVADLKKIYRELVQTLKG